MFWFNKSDDRAVFVDKRCESHVLTDKSSKGGSRELVINPDIQANFTALPFENETFSLVVFDPPPAAKKNVQKSSFRTIETALHRSCTAGAAAQMCPKPLSNCLIPPPRCPKPVTDGKNSLKPFIFRVFQVNSR
jgi:hypothetical protein